MFQNYFQYIYDICHKEACSFVFFFFFLREENINIFNISPGNKERVTRFRSRVKMTMHLLQIMFLERLTFADTKSREDYKKVTRVP